MHKGKIEIEIVEVPCRRCGKSIRTLKRSLLGANELRDKLGGIQGVLVHEDEAEGAPQPREHVQRHSFERAVGVGEQCRHQGRVGGVAAPQLSGMPVEVPVSSARTTSRNSA